MTTFYFFFEPNATATPEVRARKQAIIAGIDIKVAYDQIAGAHEAGMWDLTGISKSVKGIKDYGDLFYCEEVFGHPYPITSGDRPDPAKKHGPITEEEVKRIAYKHGLTCSQQEIDDVMRLHNTEWVARPFSLISRRYREQNPLATSSGWYHGLEIAEGWFSEEARVRK